MAHCVKLHLGDLRAVKTQWGGAPIVQTEKWTVPICTTDNTICLQHKLLDVKESVKRLKWDRSVEKKEVEKKKEKRKNSSLISQ